MLLPVNQQEVQAAAKKSGYHFSGYTAPATAGELYTLRYAAFTVMLVKGMQEQQQLIASMQQQVQSLQAGAAALVKKNQ